MFVISGKNLNLIVFIYTCVFYLQFINLFNKIGLLIFFLTLNTSFAFTLCFLALLFESYLLCFERLLSLLLS